MMCHQSTPSLGPPPMQAGVPSIQKPSANLGSDRSLELHYVKMKSCPNMHATIFGYAVPTDKHQTIVEISTP
eukprot:1819058-Amphidinium_carterae.1